MVGQNLFRLNKRIYFFFPLLLHEKILSMQRLRFFVQDQPKSIGVGWGKFCAYCSISFRLYVFMLKLKILFFKTISTSSVSVSVEVSFFVLKLRCFLRDDKPSSLWFIRTGQIYQRYKEPHYGQFLKIFLKESLESFT